ncbi:hypothetical protein HDU96_003570, partial [Phlyctochytrium bullatum]
DTAEEALDWAVGKALLSPEEQAQRRRPAPGSVLEYLVACANEALRLQERGTKDEMDDAVLRGMRRCGHLAVEGRIVLPPHLRADWNGRDEGRARSVEVPPPPPPEKDVATGGGMVAAATKRKFSKLSDGVVEDDEDDEEEEDVDEIDDYEERSDASGGGAATAKPARGKKKAAPPSKRRAKRGSPGTNDPGGGGDVDAAPVGKWHDVPPQLPFPPPPPPTYVRNRPSTDPAEPLAEQPPHRGGRAGPPRDASGSPVAPFPDDQRHPEDFAAPPNNWPLMPAYPSFMSYPGHPFGGPSLRDASSAGARGSPMSPYAYLFAGPYRGAAYPSDSASPSSPFLTGGAPPPEMRGRGDTLPRIPTRTRITRMGIIHTRPRRTIMGIL